MGRDSGLMDCVLESLSSPLPCSLTAADCEDPGSKHDVRYNSECRASDEHGALNSSDGEFDDCTQQEFDAVTHSQGPPPQPVLAAAPKQSSSVVVRASICCSSTYHCPENAHSTPPCQRITSVLEAFVSAHRVKPNVPSHLATRVSVAGLVLDVGRAVTISTSLRKQVRTINLAVSDGSTRAIRFTAWGPQADWCRSRARVGDVMWMHRVIVKEYGKSLSLSACAETCLFLGAEAASVRQNLLAVTFQC